MPAIALGYRTATAGETPTHFHHMRLGLTAPLDLYREVMDGLCGGQSDCVLMLVVDTADTAATCAGDLDVVTAPQGDPVLAN